MQRNSGRKKKKENGSPRKVGTGKRDVKNTTEGGILPLSVGLLVLLLAMGTALILGRVELEYKSRPSLAPPEEEDGPYQRQLKREEQLPSILSRIHDRLIQDSRDWDLFLRDQKKNFGPVHVVCGRTDGNGGYDELYSKSFGAWMPEGKHAAVGIRSVSKMIIAASYLVLVELGEYGLTLDTTLESVIPACSTSQLGDATAGEMLSMLTPLDNRVSVATAVALGASGDHVHFPPICDTASMSPEMCVEDIICPMFAPPPETVVHNVSGTETWTQMAGTLNKSLKTASQRMSLYSKCVDKKETECHRYSEKGYCQTAIRYMHTYCHASCGLCPEKKMMREVLTTKSLRGLAKDSPARSFWWELNPVSDIDGNDDEEDPFNGNIFLGVDEHEEDIANSEKKDSEASEYFGTYNHRHGCRYDNYGYTLLDALVMRRTGIPLWKWAIKLIAEPLGLEDMIRCMPLSENRKGGGEEIKGCYASPTDETSQKQAVVTGEYSLSSGPESLNWPGCTIFASSSDLAKFMAMLMNNGKYANHQDASKDEACVAKETIQILKPEYVSLILGEGDDTYKNDQAGECHGMAEFTLGLGKCSGERQNVNLCRGSTTYWGWGGSYGTRALALRTPGGGPDYTTCTSWQNATADRKPGIVCSVAANLGTIIIDGSSPGHRIASRQHYLANAQAAQIAAVFADG